MKDEKKIDDYLRRFHKLEQVRVKINDKLLMLREKIREEVRNGH